MSARDQRRADVVAAGVAAGVFTACSATREGDVAWAAIVALLALLLLMAEVSR